MKLNEILYQREYLLSQEALLDKIEPFKIVVTAESNGYAVFQNWYEEVKLLKYFWNKSSAIEYAVGIILELDKDVDLKKPISELTPIKSEIRER